jgi:hypothetical protein
MCPRGVPRKLTPRRRYEKNSYRVTLSKATPQVCLQSRCRHPADAAGGVFFIGARLSATNRHQHARSDFVFRFRLGKQAPGCRELSSSSVVRGLLCSAPDGDQHCDDHDGSGGMRKSGYEVDDAGDTSNTEIGHVAYLPSRTSVAITPRVRSCRIGLSRAKRESGEGILAGSQKDPRLEQ